MAFQIYTQQGLDNLPEDTRIEDTGLIAVKRNGAWHYNGIGAFEPENFPVTVLDD